MTRRNNVPLALSPVLIGAVTILVATVAVFLTYNANSGLPFAPTYDITVTVPDASALAAGREVRVAGKRIGVIGEVRAVHGERGAAVAELDLELDKAVEPIRADTVVRVRPLSPLGAKYLELEPGARGEPLESGTALPLANARPTVDLTDAFDLFDTRTRRSIRGIYNELGVGLAARGPGVNELVADLAPLMRDLEAVSAALSRPATRLDRFMQGAERATGELAAAPLGSLTDASDVTAGAFDAARAELADAISETPAAEAAGLAALRAARPALRDAELLVRDIRPGLRVLAPASRDLTAAAEEGIPALRELADLADPLESALGAVDDLARDPESTATLRKLRLALRSLRPTIRFVAPAQTVCNYFGLAGRNFPSALSEGDESGTWLRTLLVERRVPEQMPASEPAAGLHVNPYASTGQDGECEAGNEPFLPGTRIGPVEGDQGTTEPTSPPEGVPEP